MRIATIYFDDGSSRLGEGDRALVQQLAEAVIQWGGRLRVAGHAAISEAAGEDTDRRRRVHYEKSLQRAEAVSEELVRFGISRDRLAVLAEGDYQPVYQETAPTGAAGNRRTEIFLEPAYLAEIMQKPADRGPLTTDKPAKAAFEPRQEPDPPAAKVEDGTLAFVFDWPKDVAAAVFSRAPYVWIVFDQRVQIDVGSLRAQGSPLLDEIEQLPVIDSTVLRLRPKKGISPHVQRMNKNWIVTFEHSPIEPNIPIAVEVCAHEAEGARVVFPATELGRILEIRDPGVGDMLRVMTLRAPGHGIGESRRYAEFGILPSAQGVALVSLSDKLEMAEAGAHGAMVHRPGGLQLSWAPTPAKAARASLAPQPFDLDDWHCGDAALAEHPATREPVQPSS